MELKLISKYSVIIRAVKCIAQFRYHHKCWYWPDTDTDTRTGAALVVINVH